MPAKLHTVGTTPTRLSWFWPLFCGRGEPVSSRLDTIESVHSTVHTLTLNLIPGPKAVETTRNREPRQRQHERGDRVRPLRAGVRLVAPPRPRDGGRVHLVPEHRRLRRVLTASPPPPCHRKRRGRQ